MKKQLHPTQFSGQVRFILTKAGVHFSQINECLLWAFGPDALTLPVYPNWVENWNKLHPKSFNASRKDKFVEFVFVVGTMFVFYKKQKELNMRTQ